MWHDKYLQLTVKSHLNIHAIHSNNYTNSVNACLCIQSKHIIQFIKYVTKVINVGLSFISLLFIFRLKCNYHISKICCALQRCYQ